MSKRQTRSWEGISNWQEYADLRLKQRTQLYLDAERGDKQAIAKFKLIQRQLKTETNKRLRALERHKYDYGKAYNNLMFYLNTQLKTNRALSWTKIGKDLDALEQQGKQMLRFLRMEESDWRKFERNEKWKFEYIYEERFKQQASARAKEGLPEFFKSYRSSREFLRFLGNEEVSAAMDAYGTSDVVVEMLYDAYKRDGVKVFPLLEMALAEYNAGRAASAKLGKQVGITFDEAMLRGGIKVEDYYRRKPTS